MSNLPRSERAPVLVPEVFDWRDATWLVLSLLVSGVVAASYFVTHSFPAYEGGLFLQIVEELRMEGYTSPRRVPYYTRGGVPFAYPPLGFYALAVVIEVTGVAPLTVAMYLPALVTMVSLLPYHAVAKEILESTPRAGIATVLYATTPAVLRWHVSAGGVIRAPAIVLAFAGVYAGVRLFKYSDRRWILPGTLLFGLTVLTHPHYTAFFGVSYLVLFLGYDRTRAGLLSGAAVAVGGLALATPWWLRVVTTYGPDTLLSAAGTHGGLGGGVRRLRFRFLLPLTVMDAATPFYALAFLGSGFLLVKRRYVLPAWLFLSTFVVGKARFLFVAGSMASAVVLCGALRTERRPPSRSVWSPGWRPLIAAVLVGAVVIGAMFAGSALDIAHRHSTTQPQTVDGADRAAMGWVRGHTARSATFVVLGDTAEWFPYMTERTGVVSPWGMEWTGTDRYHDEIRAFKRSSTCDSADCLTRVLVEAERRPRYAFVPKGEYTVRGKEHLRSPGMRESLVASPCYELAHENEGVMVFAVDDLDECRRTRHRRN